MEGQGADLEWTPEGVPVSRRFDDPYFSKADGLAETRHVFLKGNDLPARFHDRPTHRVAELGFGTGLTLAVMRACYREAGTGGTLHFTSFEAFPMPVADMRTALSQFPEIAPEIDDVLEALDTGDRTFTAADLRFELVVGDARQTLPRWQGQAETWCLDGFSPARNPELWEAELMQAVAEHTAPGGHFATYTAAGHVRRALGAAGFDVTRCAGFGRKRHMTAGRLA
jgi:tRNA U34 5-methylaminomethyl-2-thiouridine-forming methyltransferase MnmC